MVKLFLSEYSSMDNIFESLKQNWYIIAVILVVCVVSWIFNIARMKKMKSTGKNFLQQHPDAAKVYLTTKALITSEAVEIYTVNGDHPQRFTESGKTGFYLVPGTSAVEISYSYTRPGVIHKNVTTTTDVVKKELVTEANQTYILGFDRKEEVFTFEKYTD